jgi:hypothetical protein
VGRHGPHVRDVQPAKDNADGVEWARLRLLDLRPARGLRELRVRCRPKQVAVMLAGEILLD